jgi:hypothetical protein
MHAESLEQRWIKRSDLRVGASVGHGQQTGAVVLQLEVLIGKLLAVDGLAASALELESIIDALEPMAIVRGAHTLPRVKSPPWSMKLGMMRWKEEPL